MDEKKMKDRFEYFLKLRGLSLTRERRELIQFVANMSKPFTVDDLFFTAHAAGLRLSKATVYRTIEIMVEGRFLRESELAGRQMTYEFTEPGQNSGMMTCEHCGRTFEFKGPVLERFIHEVAMLNQFLPIATNIRMSGFCNECVKANPPSLRKEVCVPMLKLTHSREN